MGGKFMKKEEIKKYFAKGKDWSEKERKDNTGWSLEDSSIEEGDVKKLEEELQITFPKKYCEYIMAAAHRFTTLVGKFDNFFFEDDVDIEIKIVPQPYGEELKYIRKMLKENEIIVQQKYLPLGEFDEDGYLCIDLKNNNEIVWLPFENCVGFTKREEFEEEQLHIFDDLDDFIKCFFGKEKYVIEE